MIKATQTASHVKENCILEDRTKHNKYFSKINSRNPLLTIYILPTLHANCLRKYNEADPPDLPKLNTNKQQNAPFSPSFILRHSGLDLDSFPSSFLKDYRLQTKMYIFYCF